MIFRRKIYQKLLNWKEKNGRTALLIEGARRVGKSTIIEEFASKEYKSYILIDFSEPKSAVMDAFRDSISDLDNFFQIISVAYREKLYERESLIIFDEVQLFPIARQAIKHLVKDGRFDYIESGSLLSIRENVQDILLPSEEERISMYPMDFEEFAEALDEGSLISYIRECFENKKPLQESLHRKALMLFREYIIVGGMPQCVRAYAQGRIRSFEAAEEEKKNILSLYRGDIMKSFERYRNKVISLYDQIPSFLSKHEKRIKYSAINADSRFNDYSEAFFFLDSAMIANLAFNTTDPEVGLSLNEDRTYVKCYMGDTGLLLSHSFDENEEVDKALYQELYLGKLSVNEGMFFENAIAQTLKANGHKLFFYTHYDATAKRNDIEIDFIISKGGKIRNKIYPIEVKSSDTYSLKSLMRFREKYSRRIGDAYVIHTKNYSEKDGIIFLPCYMAFLL